MMLFSMAGTELHHEAADCVHINEMRFLVRDRRAPDIPPEHDGQLLPGDGALGPNIPQNWT